jgi:hypothetical protein
LSKKDRKEFNLQLIKDFKAYINFFLQLMYKTIKEIIFQSKSKQNEKSKAASNASDKGFYSNQQSI